MGQPISQLAYVEVHLHVQPDGHVKCELIRVSQHSKALQALGLQDSSPSKPSPEDKDLQAAADTAEPHTAASHQAQAAESQAVSQLPAEETPAATATDGDGDGDGDGAKSEHDGQEAESHALDAAHQAAADGTAGDAASLSRSGSQHVVEAANDLSPRTDKSRAVFRHQRSAVRTNVHLHKVLPGDHCFVQCYVPCCL